MTRYRYHNDSPKRARWESAHQFVKADPNARPIRFPHHTVAHVLRWVRLTGAVHEAKGFEMAFPQHGKMAAGALKWWKLNCQTMKQHGKEDGFIYRRTTARRPTKRARSNTARATGAAQ